LFDLIVKVITSLSRASIGRAKAPGPIAQRMMCVLLPVMLQTMNIEKTAATEQRYTIDCGSRRPGCCSCTYLTSLTSYVFTLCPLEDI
jgi:hypothetical protein